MVTNKKFPFLGFGLGLRTPHYQTILETTPNVDWFEIISENFMVKGGRPFYYLDQIRERYPIVMHGVSLSIGSIDPLNDDYLAQLKKLAQRVSAKWISDHLCWTGINHKNTHDLLPLPYTEEALNHVVERVKIVQDTLNQPLLLENPSTYLTYKESTLSEWDFLNALHERTGCYFLLDINNIYVSSFNHELNPETYLNALKPDAVKQFHLAGHSHKGTHIIDTHDDTVIQTVWELYEKAVKRFGAVSTMIERDDNIPPLDELIDELNMARDIFAQATHTEACLET